MYKVRTIGNTEEEFLRVYGLEADIWVEDLAQKVRVFKTNYTIQCETYSFKECVTTTSKRRMEETVKPLLKRSLK